METALVAHASVTVPAKAGGVARGWGSSLAAAAAGLGRWGVPQGWAFPIAAWTGAGFQGLVHLLADDVHQALKDLLYVYVLLGARLEELETWMDIDGGTCETQRGKAWAVASYKSGFQALLCSCGPMTECLSL